MPCSPTVPHYEHEQKNEYKMIARLSGKTHLWWHVVQRVEVRVDVRDEHLRGQRCEQALRVSPEVGRDLRALPDTDLQTHMNLKE